MPITCSSPDGHNLFPDEEWPWWRIMIVQFIEWLENTFLPPAPGYACIDCEKYGHGWVVTDEVWVEICKDESQDPDNPHVIYCCECAEKHLGRQLKMKDFPNLLINRPLRFGHKLGQREKNQKL